MLRFGVWGETRTWNVRVGNGAIFEVKQNRHGWSARRSSALYADPGLWREDTLRKGLEAIALAKERMRTEKDEEVRGGDCTRELMEEVYGEDDGEG